MTETNASTGRMTGPEHYQEAERLIMAGVHDEDGDDRLLTRDIALAQVHAILALAAATAICVAAEGAPLDDFDEWRAAAGVTS